MVEFIRQFLKSSGKIFTKLTTQQKIIIGGVTIFASVSLILLMSWANERTYKTLYSNLDPEDAYAIKEKLEEQNIKYKLVENETEIQVPEGQETRLRLDLAGEGLIPGGTVVGFGLFDEPSIGMTDFIQKINFRRALQGELARTLKSFAIVKDARVNITMPEQRLFEKDKIDPTASVTLTIEGNAELSKEQIQSIANFVAYSVEGLKPENISIVDTYGNNLSAGLNMDPLIALSASQIEQERNIEASYRREVETQLNTLLGPNNSVVRVNVEMDYSKATIHNETYDPTSQAVVSEERNESSGGTQDTLATGETIESSISNYVYNKTVTQTADDFGKIKRMTVSVSVNRAYDRDTRQYSDRDPADLLKIEELVKNAIGYNADRRDEVTVVEFGFDTTIREEEEERQRDMERTEMAQRVIKWVMMAVAGVLFMIVLRSVFKSLDLLLPKTKPKPAIDIEAEAIEEEISAEAQRRAQMLEQVTKFTREKPVNVASLLQTWLIEEKAGE